MDPVTLIVTALTAGATASQKGTSDAAEVAYTRLLAAVRERLAGNPAGELALAGHVADLRAGQALLTEELARAWTNDDASLAAASIALLELLDPAGAQAGTYTITVPGSKGAQVGDHNIQFNSFFIGKQDYNNEADNREARGTSQSSGIADRPARREDFFERPGDLAKLDLALASALRESSPVVVAVTGPGGVGKTTLVRQWVAGVLDRERIKPDDYFSIDLGGFSPGGKVSPHEALERLVRHLTPGGQVADSTGGTVALIKQFREQADLRSFLLITLDDALNEEHVRSLIPVTGRALVIITSRKAWMQGLAIKDGFRLNEVKIDRLHDKDSLRLLTKSIGRIRREDQSAAREIAKYCCGLPLAIRIAAALIQGAQYSMRELAGKLKEPDTRFMMLYTGDGATDLSPVFEASYSRLSKNGQRAFRLLGLRLGQNIDDFAVAQLAGIGIAEATLLLREMHHVGLVEKDGDRFVIHDLLHGFAVHLAPEEGSGTWRAALSGVLDGYYWCVNYEFHRRNANNPMLDVDFLSYQERLAPGGKDAVKNAGDWFEAERANLVDLVRRSCGVKPPLQRAPMLAFSLFYFLEAGGYWAEWDTVNQDGYRAARELGDIFSCARLKRNIGRLEFVKIRDQANALRDDQVQDEENLNAIRTQCLQAIDRLEESIRIYEECGPEQEWEVVTVHREIADVHLELARVDPAESHQAISAYLEAQGRYFRRENPENPIASLNVSLSAAYRIAGDYENAEKCLPPALDYARQLNDDGNPKHPRVLGYGWLRWAELCETRGAPGDFEKAIACYDNAIEAFHDYANPLSEARTMARKGRLLARTSRSGEALGLMVQAKKILAGHHPDEAKVVEAWISQLSIPGSR